MSPTSVIDLIATAVASIGAAIARGATREQVLESINRIDKLALQIDADVDSAARGKEQVK